MIPAPVRPLALLAGPRRRPGRLRPDRRGLPGRRASHRPRPGRRRGRRTARRREPAPLPAGETRDVTIETDQGEILIHVEADLSPIAAGNFVALAECGFYDGVVFHRLVPGFVIQGGDGENGRSPDVDPSLAARAGRATRSRTNP